jgi:hypothetical protein
LGFAGATDTGSAVTPLLGAPGALATGAEPELLEPPATA